MGTRQAIVRLMIGSAAVCTMWAVVAPWWWESKTRAHVGQAAGPSAVDAVPLFRPALWGWESATPYRVEHRWDVLLLALSAAAMLISVLLHTRSWAQYVARASGAVVGGAGIIAIVRHLAFVGRDTLDYGPWLAVVAGAVALSAAWLHRPHEDRVRPQRGFFNALTRADLNEHMVPLLVERLRYPIATAFSGTVLALVSAISWDVLTGSWVDGLSLMARAMQMVMLLLVGVLLLVVGLTLLRVVAELMVIPFRIHDAIARRSALDTSTFEK